VYVKGALPVEDEVDVSERFKLKLMYSENQALLDKDEDEAWNPVEAV